MTEGDVGSDNFSLASSADEAGIAKDTASPARKRRPRRKPAMLELYRPYVDGARANHKRRPVAQRVAVETDEAGDNFTFGPEHRDLEAWEVSLCDAFGTRSGPTYWTFLHQLGALMPKDHRYGEREAGYYWQPNECELNAAVNIVNGIRPKNEMEACMAAQMVAVHWMQMRTASQALAQTFVNPKLAVVASQLARTFAKQTDALARSRRTGKQTIRVKVEKHVHSHRHVHMHGDPGGGNSGARADATNDGVQKTSGLIEGQAYRVADLEHGEGSEVPGQDEGRRVVPFRGRAG